MSGDHNDGRCNSAGARSRVRRFADVVTAAIAWRRVRIAFFSGAASALSFAPIFASPVLFVTLPVLVWLIDAARDAKDAAKVGWWFGFGYFFASLFWIGEAFLVEAEKFAVLLPLAVTLLPAGMAAFWAIGAAVSKRFWSMDTSRVLLLAIALTSVEWVRGHVFTGLPWNVIGYALTAPDVWMQGAALVGIYGLTTVAVIAFAWPLVCINDAGRFDRRAIYSVVLATVLPLIALTGYGAWRLAGHELKAADAFVPGVQLRIVQPSIIQREKWMAEYQQRIFKNHLTLSGVNEAGVRDDLNGVTHLVWPEAAMPFLPLEHPEALSAIAELLPPSTVLISGALRRDGRDVDGNVLPIEQHRLFNGVMVFDSDGQLVTSYDKIHLVPFGEYLPFEPVLSALGLKKLTHGRGSFTPGPTPRPLLDIAGLPKLLALVCYEALFPAEVVQSVERPSLILNVTNDGWFGQTSGPHQHFHQTRVRAVEEGVPVIRAANNGISAVVDRFGRVLDRLPLDAKGVIDSRLPTASAAPPPFARFGDGVALLLLGLVGALWSVSRATSCHDNAA